MSDIYMCCYGLSVGDICQEELAKIECPTLIIEGGNDAIVPGFHPEYLRQHIKNSQ